MVNVLVTGANGQLARCIKDLVSNDITVNFIFKDSKELNITESKEIELFFESNPVDYCINCAAYTAVDTAESNIDAASKVNVLGVGYLARECSKNNAVLIHISTDFVFDGSKAQAYTETDSTNPKGVYGKTKLQGEHEIPKYLSNFFIIRTSWLYSEYGNNFMKTMIRLSEIKDKLSVVGDQIGTPTYAKDLAKVILKIVDSKSNNYGVYHYSNEGVASWYDFAHSIFEVKNSKVKLTSIKTINYPTPAERPSFSVLDKDKIKSNFQIDIPHWRESLKNAIINLKNT